MQLKAFEAALRLILPGPGDQPLMRILRIAMQSADCSCGLIGVRWDDRFQIIVSSGIPLADFRVDLRRSDSIANRLLSPVVIEDASADADFADHVYVKGSPHWRYIASVPLPLSILPYDVVLNVADSRTGVERPADLLARLDDCAAIAADELRLIGDIACQVESINEVQKSSQVRDRHVLDGGLPMAMLGSGGSVRLINDRLRGLLNIADQHGHALTISDLFPMDAPMLTARLDEVLEAGAAANAIVAHSNDRRKTYLVDLIRVVSDDASQPLALCTVTDRTRTFAKAEALEQPHGESPNVIADFLAETLVSQKRLLRRGPVPYHALRRWRSPVKDVQLAALKALKREPSQHFVDSVADELAAAAVALFGDQTLHAVVAVPCGNSGSNCLAARLAAGVADRLKLPNVAAFADLAPSGGSHPKSNLRRAKMQIVEPVDVPVLLIDDVATTGTHVAEAAMALKANGTPAVLPLVWLAAS